MRLMQTVKPSVSLVTNKGTYVNSKGKSTHHKRAAETPIKFVGVDGEGMMVNGEHKYVLFGIGGEQIENANGLEWKEVFEFLYSHYRPGTAFVGFYLSYDFTQIIKTMPEDKAWMLLTSEGRALRKHRIKGKAPHPVEYDGWQFDMLTMKRLRIRPKTCQCPYPTCKCNHAPWMYICDVGGFFQSSFLTVINPKSWKAGTEVVTSEEYAMIERGKNARSVATLDDDMRHYNALENQILSRVMANLDNGFREIGIGLPPSKWFGPGQAAQAWLKSENVPNGETVRESVPAWYLEAARMSYFGGWFEQMMHGIIPGDTHEYDINSAYPSIISQLPCLLHGTYSHGEGLPTVRDGELCLVYGKVWSPLSDKQRKGLHIGTMLHRSHDGSISRPDATEGWFWWHELKAAEKCKLIKGLTNRGFQRIEKWVKYTPCNCPPPMAGIRGLYERRLAVGKDTPKGKAAKLVYNSAYGKFAQSVGEPVYGNPIYASLITAGCRTMILDAIASHPMGKTAVAMVATDAVYFLDPHPSLTISDQLGEWDYKAKRRLTLFKPGVYWDDKSRQDIAEGRSPHFKARGFKAADFAANIARVDAEYESWADGNTPEANELYSRGWPEVTFKPTFMMVTALQALRRKRWDLAGSVAENPEELRQNANPSDKRYLLYAAIYNGRTVWRSEPKPGWTIENDTLICDASKPYEKRFGMEDPWSDEYKEQMGINWDGNIADILAWILIRGE